MKTLFFILTFFFSPHDVPEFRLIPDASLSAIELHWSALDANILEYHLYKTERGKEWLLHATIYGDENSVVDWDVKRHTIYQYCMWAKYKDGQVLLYSKPIQVVWD